MVALAAATDRLHQGDAALRAAVSSLIEAMESFRAAGRADLLYPLRSAVVQAREAELLRQTGAIAGPPRDPADWFLD